MKKLLLLLAMGFLVSCANTKQGDTLVEFMEQEEGVEPFKTRMIITEKFVRIDDGEGSTSFVLFDRNKKVVYSTNPEEKRIMSVHEKKFADGEKIEPPFKLIHTTKEMPELKDAPTINGKKAKHFQLITNEQICYDVVSIKDLMPDVIEALSEFHRHMATDSMSTFNNMPADMHDACDMTKSTFAPARHFTFGFPIQEWGKRGYIRSLIDYKLDYKADPELFALPEGYKEYTVQELREGKVVFEN